LSPKAERLKIFVIVVTVFFVLPQVSFTRGQIRNKGEVAAKTSDAPARGLYSHGLPRELLLALYDRAAAHRLNTRAILGPNGGWIILPDPIAMKRGDTLIARAGGFGGLSPRVLAALGDWMRGLSETVITSDGGWMFASGEYFRGDNLAGASLDRPRAVQGIDSGSQEPPWIFLQDAVGDLDLNSGQ